MKVIRRRVLDDIVKRLVAEFQPEKILLFGSRAWGTPGRDSDLDLMVVVPDSDAPPAERARRAHRCLRGVPVPTDILVKTRREIERFRSVHASLEAEVLERGKVLYG